MAILTTGQITIVDNNDARSITSYITTPGQVNQIFTKEDTIHPYNPNWVTTPLVLTARAYRGDIGGVTDITNSLTERKWSYSLGGAAIDPDANGEAPNSDYFVTTGSPTPYLQSSFPTSGSSDPTTLTIVANLKEGSTPLTIYFTGTFTDPITTLSSSIITTIQLLQVKTGTNATWVRISGQTKIEPAVSGQRTDKKVIVIYSDLIRAADVDDTNVSYKWFTQTPTENQIDFGYPSVSSLYGFLDLAAVNAYKAGTLTINASSIGQYYTGTSGAAISNVNAPIDSFSAAKGLIIHEDAVNSIALYQSIISDDDISGKYYQGSVTISDVSDPYSLLITSSAGDKLQNGQGTTVLTPRVYYGGIEVTGSNLQGWDFYWQLNNKDGLRGGFVNPAITATADGIKINSNTAWDSGNNEATFVLAADPAWTGGHPAAGSLIKVVLGTVAKFYQVKSYVSPNLKIQPATGNWDWDPITKTQSVSITNWLNFTSYPQPILNEFQNGKLFVCDYYRLSSATTADPNYPQSLSYITTNAAGNEIDIKGTFICNASKGSV